MPFITTPKRDPTEAPRPVNPANPVHSGSPVNPVVKAGRSLVVKRLNRYGAMRADTAYHRLRDGRSSKAWTRLSGNRLSERFNHRVAKRRPRRRIRETGPS